MRRFLPLLAVLLFQSCGPKDKAKFRFDGTVTVPPRQFFYKVVDLPIGGSYTLTAAPADGELEIWSQPGSQQPFVEYNLPPIPGCTRVSPGQEGSHAGGLGWGSSTFVVFNRSTQPVQAKIHLEVLSNER